MTTRSNLYAVWITVGYFEVTQASQLPQTADRRRPNSKLFIPTATSRPRMGTDTGDFQRHRAFYIFDRTIPVGFQRGQDMNVDKAILVNRFIE